MTWLYLCFSWMPMNIFNVVADSATNFFSENIEAMYIVYAICHMFGMSSVITPLPFSPSPNRLTSSLYNHVCSVKKCLENASLKERTFNKI